MIVRRTGSSQSPQRSFHECGTKDITLVSYRKLRKRHLFARSCIGFLLFAHNKHTGTNHDAMRAAMVKSFVDADRVCRRSSHFFTDEQHEEFCMHSERFLVCYNSLAAEAINGDKKLYKLLPKFHASTHHWDSRTNPRAVHCYADEDMVGRLKRIFITCHHSTAAKRALQRYAIVVCLRWWHAVHELKGIPRT